MPPVIVFDPSGKGQPLRFRIPAEPRLHVCATHVLSVCLRRSDCGSIRSPGCRGLTHRVAYNRRSRGCLSTFRRSSLSRPLRCAARVGRGDLRPVPAVPAVFPPRGNASRPVSTRLRGPFWGGVPAVPTLGHPLGVEDDRSTDYRPTDFAPRGSRARIGGSGNSGNLWNITRSTTWKALFVPTPWEHSGRLRDARTVVSRCSRCSHPFRAIGRRPPISGDYRGQPSRGLGEVGTGGNARPLDAPPLVGVVWSLDPF